jgi:hypothetical protein
VLDTCGCCLLLEMFVKMRLWSVRDGLSAFQTTCLALVKTTFTLVQTVDYSIFAYSHVYWSHLEPWTSRENISCRTFAQIQRS